ncbi:MAG: hypothetical protein COS99_07840 [Candidatus Omnitrophica bacterium CG07_land_8_20_14_0_80_42_15]|uniref:SHSP domain-containing protein n=1 Tax=Candidatus Aquitaenariimonas noxiae TaxID=1974741 RepID=A0A2J0KQS4_9BACT|nr:MAG: hypothetical protein COS99_07840 [Candidatus Omnitrophica bacterium CG07_land_8_20_14_0_80_42_15]
MKRIILLTVLISVITAQNACAENATDKEVSKMMNDVKTRVVEMKKEMDNLMRDVVEAYPWNEATSIDNFGNDMKVDITENNKEVMVKADMPGVEKDRINVTLEGDRTLKIAGSREVLTETKEPGVVKQERSQSKFERDLALPVPCANSGIKASYKNGVLEVIIPKAPKTKPESVKVNIM